MRCTLIPLLLALAGLPAAARAQDPAPAGARPPAEVVERITRIFNDTTTIRLSGDSRIAPGTSITGSVAVLEGSLTVGGRVEGDVAVLNGDLELLPTAVITGTVTVVGGQVSGAEAARLSAPVVAYAGRLDFVRRGARIHAPVDGALPPPKAEVARADEPAGDWRRVDADTAPHPRRDAGRGDDDWRQAGEIGVRRRSAEGRAEFVVTTGNGYNRVEGLPITFGPVFETPGSNPFRFRLNGVYRTEVGPALDPGRWGFEARAEQFFGGRREIRLGGTLTRAIEPIEEWQISKLENGLSTFLFRRDFRDHYLREGGSVYARVDPRGWPFSATAELRLEKHAAVEAGSPWSLFRNDEPWRPQPLAAAGRLHTLALSTRWDTRNEPEEPSTGWLVQTEVEQALTAGVGGLTGALVAPDDLPGATFTQRDYGRFTRALVDVRRYNRISPTSRLNLRLLAGGTLGGGSLPPQRQHALGGEGSLPGFPLFALDCGARDRRVVLSRSDGAAPRFFPAYGCDRFALAQAEYRGELDFRLDLDALLGGGDGDEEEWGDGDGGPVLETGLSWVLFADAGGGWTRDPELRDEATVADVGFGVLLGRLGAYLALPVTGGGDGVNFFIRLNPRF